MERVFGWASKIAETLPPLRGARSNLFVDLDKEEFMANVSGRGELPTMPDPSKGNSEGGLHLPTMPDPVNDPERRRELPRDPDPELPPRIGDPPRNHKDERRRA
jgi:hypothetical protein